MPNSDNMTAIADLVLDTTTTAQNAFLSAVSSLADTLKPVTEKLPPLPFADQRPDANETLGAAFGFAEKVLANQKAFTTKLVNTYGQGK